MLLLETQVELIRRELAEQPLIEGEVRRIKKAGGLYMALRSTRVSNEYRRIYNMAIDNNELSFYKRFESSDTGADISV